MADYLTTYSQAGNRESLTDVTADLWMDETPLYSMSGKVNAIAEKHSWVVDNLSAAATTAVVEGADISYTRPAVRVKRSNYCHIRLRFWEVSFTQAAVTSAGVKNDVARELMKALKTIATDYEKIFVITGTTAAGDSGTGRAAMGILKAIKTNTGLGTGTGNSAEVQLTEDMVNSRLAEIWEAGGNPRALICNSHSKMVIAKKFSQKTGFTFNVDSTTRTAIANINKYEGAFGTLNIIPDKHIPKRRIAIVTPEQIKIAVLRDIKSYQGTRDASTYKGWVEGEMTLQFGNEKAHGEQEDLKYSGSIS